MDVRVRYEEGFSARVILYKLQVVVGSNPVPLLVSLQCSDGGGCTSLCVATV